MPEITIPAAYPATTVLITGNTYPVRLQMRDLGGVWNKPAQGWDIPAAKADEARALVAGTGSRPASRGRFAARPPRSRYGSSYTRFAGGGEVFTNLQGRCEDAPCCGCCS